MGMWVPNSERGHKIQSPEGENEIPHIPFLFFSKNVILSGGAKVRWQHFLL